MKNGERKPRLLIIGGMHRNVPPQLSQYFDIARHVEQSDRRFGTTWPHVDHIMVITNWVNAGAVSSARKGLPNADVIWVHAGWRSIRDELIRRHLITLEEAAPVADQETEIHAPPSADDPYANMSLEELEKATRPEEHVPEPAAPEPQPASIAAPGAGETKAVDVDGQWRAHVARWAASWTVEIGQPVERIIEVVSAAVTDVDMDTFRQGLGLDDLMAHKMCVGFWKSRGKFRKNIGLAPLTERRPKTERKPPPFASDVDRLLAEYFGLNEEKQKLLQEQMELEQKIHEVDKQIEVYKPLADQLKALNRAAQQVREKIGQPRP
jgi:hypothetical protein